MTDEQKKIDRIRQKVEENRKALREAESQLDKLKLTLRKDQVDAEIEERPINPKLDKGLKDLTARVAELTLQKDTLELAERRLTEDFEAQRGEAQFKRIQALRAKLKPAHEKLLKAIAELGEAANQVAAIVMVPEAFADIGGGYNLGSFLFPPENAADPLVGYVQRTQRNAIFGLALELQNQVARTNGSH